MEEGGLDRVRRELAVTLLKGDFPFLSSGQTSRKRMSLSVSWERHLLRIADHTVSWVLTASHREQQTH